MMIKSIQRMVIAAGFAAWSMAAIAADSGIFSPYRIGVSYSTTTSYASITYNAPTVSQLPPDCSTDKGSSDLMHCQAYLAPDHSDSSSVSVFFDQPFKRQGLFYFEPGFTFATISYKGGLGSRPVASIGGGNAKSSTAETAGSDQTAVMGQPLTKAYMEMYGINWQGYLRFGVTPQYLPDILFSLGLGVQTVGGRLKIFKQASTRYVIQPEAFGEVEAVLVRAGTGSLSVFYGQDQTLVSRIGSKLIDDHPSGTNLTNFQLNLVSGSAGVRLLFPF